MMVCTIIASYNSPPKESPISFEKGDLVQISSKKKENIGGKKLKQLAKDSNLSLTSKKIQKQGEFLKALRNSS